MAQYTPIGIGHRPGHDSDPSRGPTLWRRRSYGQNNGAEKRSSHGLVDVPFQSTMTENVVESQESGLPDQLKPESNSGPSQRIPARSRVFTRDSWTQEILACTVAFLSMVSIIVVLLVYQGNHTPIALPISIRLGSILSLLSTIIEAAIAVPIAAGLSQLAWAKFAKGQLPLSDIENYDRASRGIEGGILTLWRRRGDFKVVLAVIIGIMTFLVGPFTQQTLNSKKLQSKTTLPRCESTWYPQAPSAYRALFSQYEGSLSSGDYGAWGKSSQTLQELNKDCPSGSCDWPVYSTLGICSQSTNITEHVKQECSNGECTLSLPNSLKLDTATNNITGLTGDSSTINYKSWGSYPIAKFSLLSHVAPRYGATEGVLYWCVQAYNSSVRFNVLNSTLTHSWYDMNATAKNDTPSITLIPPKSEWSTLGINRETNFTVHDNTTAHLGFITSSLNNSAHPSSYSILSSLQWANLVDFSDAIAYAATSMTNRLRSEVCNDSIAGVQHNVDTVLAVDWAWLALPVATVLLTCLFLALVVVESHPPDVRIWKSSMLPALFHGLSDDVRREFGTGKVMRLKEMEEVARDIHVSMRRKVSVGPDVDGVLMHPGGTAVVRRHKSSWWSLGR